MRRLTHAYGACNPSNVRRRHSAAAYLNPIPGNHAGNTLTATCPFINKNQVTESNDRHSPNGNAAHIADSSGVMKRLKMSPACFIDVTNVIPSFISYPYVTAMTTLAENLCKTNTSGCVLHCTTYYYIRHARGKMCFIVCRVAQQLGQHLVRILRLLWTISQCCLSTKDLM